MWLGIFSFTFAALVAVLIQAVLLPHVLPRLHAGHGLLVGGDWLVFHRVAVELAQEMARQGWQVWQLQPAGHGPAGVAALFYAVFTPEPWVLIPLNAALHALATVLLARIVWIVTGRIGISILAALPFLLYPSASAWYAQIHKDGFFIAGFFACIYGWLRLARIESWHVPRAAAAAVLWIVGGTLLIGLMRDYGVQLMVALGVPFALVAGYRLWCAPWPIGRRLLALGAMFGILAATGWISTNRYKAGEIDARNALDFAPAPVYENGDPDRVKIKPIKAAWHWTSPLPRRVDEYFYTVSVLRHTYVVGYQSAKSTLDREVRFDSAADFPPYLLRAVQIGFLAPFPRDWFGEGSIEAGSFMRRVSALEMLGVYVALIFLPYSLWRWRKRTEAWLVFGACFLAVVLYAYLIPNVGTLYRMRYGFLMAIVALGVAGALTLLEQPRRREIAE